MICTPGTDVLMICDKARRNLEMYTQAEASRLRENVERLTGVILRI